LLKLFFGKFISSKVNFYWQAYPFQPLDTSV
jgi:hypothetical protein